MKKIALISCSKYKKDYLETSSGKDVELFKLSYDYAKKYADEIYILSARYGILKEGEYLSSYNEHLDYMSESESKLWAISVLEKLVKVSDIHEDEYIILAGKSYYKNFVQFLKNADLPFSNLSLDESILFLNKEINEEPLEITNYCEKLHYIFNSLEKYTINDLDEIPFTNGIYVILDKEEKYMDMNKIVGVETHIGENRLIVRVKKHFKNGAKDESDLRKDIGRAILEYNCLDYGAMWNIDFVDEKNKVEYSHLRNFEIESNLEKMISYYINERFQIVCFEVCEEKKRNRIVEGILSSLHKDESFLSSKKWLGNYSTVENIKKSTMWIYEGFDKEILSEKELREVISLCLEYDKMK